MISLRTAPAAAATMLATGLVLGGTSALAASPALAAATRPAAATATVPAGASATLRVRSVPAIPGALVFLDGRRYRMSKRGVVVIPTTSGRHWIRVRPPRSRRDGSTVQFSRWLDGIALIRRHVTLSPGTNVEQAGFVVSRPISVSFADTHGRPVPLADITQLTMANSLGQRFTFAPAHPPGTLAVNRIVRDQAGLVPLEIRYSVRNVIIDGSNVVYGGSQNFFVHKSQTWNIKVLLFPLRIEVRDALFGFPIGSAVKLTLPNGSVRVVRLGAGHAVTMPGLSRATYLLVAKGPGVGLASPSTLSKPQTAKLLLLSWVDVLAVAAFAALFIIGLPVLGGRIVRRPDGVRLPVWHVGRSRPLPAGPEPEAAVLPDPEGPASLDPATPAPGTPALPDPVRAGLEPGHSGGTATAVLAEQEAATEVFAAISVAREAEELEAAPDSGPADRAPGAGMATGVRTQAIPAAPALTRSAVTSHHPSSQPEQAHAPTDEARARPWLRRTSWPTWNWRKP